MNDCFDYEEDAPWESWTDDETGIEYHSLGLRYFTVDIVPHDASWLVKLTARGGEPLGDLTRADDLKEAKRLAVVYAREQIAEMARMVGGIDSVTR